MRRCPIVRCLPGGTPPAGPHLLRVMSAGGFPTESGPGGPYRPSRTAPWSSIRGAVETVQDARGARMLASHEGDPDPTRRHGRPDDPRGGRRHDVLRAHRCARRNVQRDRPERPGVLQGSALHHGNLPFRWGHRTRRSKLPVLRENVDAAWRLALRVRHRRRWLYPPSSARENPGAIVARQTLKRPCTRLPGGVESEPPNKWGRALERRPRDTRRLVLMRLSSYTVTAGRRV